MNAPERFYIVGIGASAGGLEALESFFAAMPPNNGMAFVVIQHLSPDYKSMMAEILSKYTTIPVCEAQDAMVVAPENIYLIPPKKIMTITDGRLHLQEKISHRGISLPIDVFFNALAQDCGDCAVAIVLSGTGSDGTQGVRAIKEADGMVIVQNASTARFDGMPHSALATGLADLILPPEEMPEALLSFLKHPQFTEKIHTVNETTNSDDVITCMLELLRDRVDVDFTQYKPNTVTRRIERRMGIKQLHRLRDYLNYLYENDTEVKALYKELLIGVTKFFRDQEAFDYLKNNVIPMIFASKHKNNVIRIWITGCSTGEEAYSLAMLFAEYKMQTANEIEIKIFATDIDQEAIDFASNGIYAEGIVADVSTTYLQQFFVRREDGKYEVSRTLRKMVVFAQHDLIKNPPFGKIDLLSCRNLFIYLKNQSQERVLRLFHFSLKKHGFLFLGNSESIPEDNKGFDCINKKYKLYQFRPDFSSQTRDNYLQSSTNSPMPQVQNDNKAAQYLSPQVSQDRTITQQFNDMLIHLLLMMYLPVCVVTDENLEVLYISDQASRYLHPAVGKPTFNLLKMVSNNVATVIRAAMTKALKTDKNVTYKAQEDNSDGTVRMLNIQVRPLENNRVRGQLFIIVFEETPSTVSDEVEVLTLNDEQGQHVADLERELYYTRETLQATIEELETSNEELQATNEELLASNEELQSTNEELQAVNEELLTVNTEHQHKIQELVELNDAMNNLLRSTHIGTVFLDEQLRIKRFTPAIRTEINLIDSDVGRPFADINHHLQYPNLLEDIQAVLENHDFKKTEIASRSGHWYWLQLSPYITAEEMVKGVVISLVNITERKETELELKRAKDSTEAANLALRNNEEQLRKYFEQPIIGMATSTADKGLLQINEKMCELCGYRHEELLRMNWQQLTHPDDLEKEEKLHQQVLNGSIDSYTLEKRYIRKDGSVIHTSIAVHCSRNAYRNVEYLVTLVQDITQRKLAEEALIASETRLREAQHIAHMGSWEWNLGNNTIQWSEEKYQLLGLNPKIKITQMRFLAVVHPDDRKNLIQTMQQRVEDPKCSEYQFDYRIRRNDGELRYISSHAIITRNEQGKAIRLHGTAQDLTERKLIEISLMQAREAAESANRAKSTFLANMSHELRTPLNGILGYTQLFRRDKALTAEQRDGIEVIHRSGEYLLTLINDILDLSKIEAGRFELSYANCDLQYLLNSIIALFRIRAQRKGIQFHYKKITPLPQTIYTDEKRLRQILINLLSNAIKFTEQGEVCLRVGYNDDRFHLEVRDTGIGIDADKLQVIFQPFQQAVEGDYRAQGTGLGLSITHKLVELLGGKLHVESKMNQGSRFWTNIVATVVNEDLPEPLKTTRIVGYQRKENQPQYQILIVDDIADNRKILMRLLQELDFNTTAVDSGEACLREVEDWLPDVILMDLVMPDMDGLTTTRKLRMRPDMVNVIIVAVSASVFNEDRNKSLAAGCQAHIAKPVQEEELLAVLQQQLHLEWVYDHQQTEEKTIEVEADGLVTLTLDPAVLNVEQAQKFIDATIRGDIQFIRQHLKAMPQDHELVKNLQQHAGHFDLKGIREVLLQYVGKNSS